MTKHKVCAILGALALGVFGSAAKAETSFNIVIGVHPNASYSPENAGKTLTKIRNEIQSRCGDLAFPSPKMRALDASLPHIVNGGSETQLRRFAATGTSVQVVSTIAACPDPAVGGRILGCARPRGPILVVQHGGISSNAQIWAHELGHAQGLIGDFGSYVDGHNTNAGFLMSNRANPNNWRMYVSECRQFYTAQNFPPIIEVDAIIEDVPLVLGEFEEAVEADPIEPTARDYLSSYWMHGLDFSVFEDDRDAILEQAIAAVSGDDYLLWPNSVLVLGYAAPDPALDLIGKVLQTETAENADADGSPLEIASAINDAKINAATALGYLAFQGDTGALDLLAPLTSPEDNRAFPFIEETRDIGTLSVSLALSASVGEALAAARGEQAQALSVEQRSERFSDETELSIDESYFERLDALTESLRGNTLLDVLE
ncbi:MAG: hypothetical protein AAGP08_01565 [Pseudomonadota bacterium]